MVIKWMRGRDLREEKERSISRLIFWCWRRENLRAKREESGEKPSPPTTRQSHHHFSFSLLETLRPEVIPLMSCVVEVFVWDFFLILELKLHGVLAFDSMVWLLEKMLLSNIDEFEMCQLVLLPLEKYFLVYWSMLWWVCFGRNLSFSYEKFEILIFCLEPFFNVIVVDLSSSKNCFVVYGFET